MVAKKYKTNLKKRVLEERTFQEKQENLREKYDIEPGPDVVVVEKTNTLKFLVRAMALLIRLAADVALVTLAFVGIVALVYPEPREALIVIIKTVIWELKDYIKF